MTRRPWRRCWHDLPAGQRPVLLQQTATLIVMATAVALGT